jgi:hypothetical protein
MAALMSVELRLCTWGVAQLRCGTRCIKRELSTKRGRDWKFRNLKILIRRIFTYMNVCIRHAAASLAARAQEPADDAGETLPTSSIRCC